jgi:hypothetical protein
MFPPASAAILSLPEGFELRYDQRWRGLGASSTIRDAPAGGFRPITSRVRSASRLEMRPLVPFQR